MFVAIKIIIISVSVLNIAVRKHNYGFTNRGYKLQTNVN